MKKIHLSLLVFGILILAGAGYVLLFEEKETISSPVEPAKTHTDNVDFGKRGFIYSHEVVKEVKDNTNEPMATAMISTFDYYVKYPETGIEKKIFSAENGSSTAVFSPSDPHAKILEGLLQVDVYDSESFAISDRYVIDLQGNEVSHEKDLPSSLGYKTYEKSVESDDGVLYARVHYSEIVNVDFPTTPEFLSLDIINQGDEVVASYSDEDFSEYGAIVPVAFSLDNFALVISARHAFPQDHFNPQIYYLQTIGGDKEVLYEQNLNVEYPDGIYELQEIELLGFVDGDTLYGTKVVDTFNDWQQVSRVESFVTFNLATKEVVDHDATYLNQINIDKENKTAYYLDDNRRITSFNFVTGVETNLSNDLYFNEYEEFIYTDDYSLFAYVEDKEIPTTEIRETQLINKPSNTKTVYTTYAYDSVTHALEDILTNSYHQDGDRVGDEHYHFIGFIN